MDLDRSHYILTQKENPLAQSERILKFSEKPPQTGRVIFEAAIQAPRPAKKAREIQQVPYRSLDAPNILDDYYVNPVDCGATGELAVALGQSVFVTSAKSTGSVDELVNFALEGSNDFATSVNWDGAGSYLAIGTNNAEVGSGARQEDPNHEGACGARRRPFVERSSSFQWLPRR